MDVWTDCEDVRQFWRTYRPYYHQFSHICRLRLALHRGSSRYTFPSIPVLAQFSCRSHPLVTQSNTSCNPRVSCVVWFGSRYVGILFSRIFPLSSEPFWCLVWSVGQIGCSEPRCALESASPCSIRLPFARRYERYCQTIVHSFGVHDALLNGFPYPVPKRRGLPHPPWFAHKSVWEASRLVGLL